MYIDFYWNGSIVGYTYHMFINEKEIDLNLNYCSKSEAINKIATYLKQTYDMNYDRGSIEFKWGGRL